MVVEDQEPSPHDIELHDVGHIPNSSVNLISLGHLLQAGAKVTGETNTITVTYSDGNILAPFTTGFLGWNMYTLKASPVHSRALRSIDYRTVHHHLSHPSKEVIRQAKQHHLDFQISQSRKTLPSVWVALKASNLNNPSLQPLCVLNVPLSLSMWTSSPSQPTCTTSTSTLSSSWMISPPWLGPYHCAQKVLH